MIARNWRWFVVTLLMIAAVHAATVLLLPRVIMLRTMARMSHYARANTMLHSQRANAWSRTVARPSPDLLYSSCVFDLAAAKGIVRVHAEDMPPTYWSVSVFDADSNNIYVLNDRHVKVNGVDFVVIEKGTYVENIHLPVVSSPTKKGIIVFRTLIDDESQAEQIDAARRHAKCEPYSFDSQ